MKKTGNEVMRNGVWLAVLPLLPLLSGCVQMYQHADRTDDYVRGELLKINGHIIELFDAEGEYAQQVAAMEPAPNIQPTYCYKTWGKVDCYTKELDGAHHRLTGFKGPVPVDPASVQVFAAGNRDAHGNIETLIEEGWVTGEEARDVQTGGSSPASPVIKSRLDDADMYGYESAKPAANLPPLPKEEVPQPTPIKTMMNY